jgi:hypothetical protein
MKQAIEDSFPHVKGGGCLQTFKKSFEIYDSDEDPKRCYVRNDINQEIHFAVLNPRNEEINFVAIDSCIFNVKDTRRCDCAVFSSNVFCFLEIKNVSVKQRRNSRIDAQRQLANTIIEFTNSGISFENHDLEAIVSFGSAKNVYPVGRAQSLNAELEFEERFKAKLLIGNARTF